MSYATGSDLVIYHDARRLGDLIADTDIRVSAGAVPTHATVTAMLSRASGAVNMSAQVGGRYTPEDLEALTDDNAEALKGLVCDLANWYLEKRRNSTLKMEDVGGAVEAHQILEALRDGELVFPTPGALEATGTNVVENEATGNCATDACNSRYGDTVNAARRFFGRRGGCC